MRKVYVAKVVKDGVLTLGQYAAVHKWIAKHGEQVSACVRCGTTTASRLEWANVSGQYKRDTSDWLRLCTSCHRQLDNVPAILAPGSTWRREYCTHGHRQTVDNLYISRRYMSLMCRQCMVERSSARWKQKKAMRGDA